MRVTLRRCALGGELNEGAFKHHKRKDTMGQKDSERLDEFCRTTTAQVKATGAIGAHTSLEMIEYIRTLERVIANLRDCTGDMWVCAYASAICDGKSEQEASDYAYKYWDEDVIILAPDVMKRLAKLEEALSFYANIDNHRDYAEGSRMSTSIEVDGGDKARAALPDDWDGSET